LICNNTITSLLSRDALRTFNSLFEMRYGGKVAVRLWLPLLPFNSLFEMHVLERVFGSDWPAYLCFQFSI